MKFEEYMRKEATLPAIAAGAWGGKKFMELAPYLVGVPLLLGSGAGYLASKLTSPAATDVETLQQEALLSKVKSEIGLRERALLARQRLEELREETEGLAGKDRFLRL